MWFATRGISIWRLFWGSSLEFIEERTPSRCLVFALRFWIGVIFIVFRKLILSIHINQNFLPPVIDNYLFVHLWLINLINLFIWFFHIFILFALLFLVLARWVVLEQFIFHSLILYMLILNPHMWSNRRLLYFLRCFKIILLSVTIIFGGGKAHYDRHTVLKLSPGISLGIFLLNSLLRFKWLDRIWKLMIFLYLLIHFSGRYVFKTSYFNSNALVFKFHINMLLSLFCLNKTCIGDIMVIRLKRFFNWCRIFSFIVFKSLQHWLAWLLRVIYHLVWLTNFLHNMRQMTKHLYIILSLRLILSTNFIERFFSEFFDYMVPVLIYF